MSLIEIVQDDSHKEFIRFCNELRCPLCQSQLDGNIQAKLATLYCCSNNEEYKIQCFPGDPLPFWEVLNFYYSQYQYEITSHLATGKYTTTIIRMNMDAEPKQRYKTRKKVFEFEGGRMLFFRARMEEDVFLKKLKLYQVFS